MYIKTLPNSSCHLILRTPQWVREVLLLSSCCSWDHWRRIWTLAAWPQNLHPQPSCYTASLRSKKIVLTLDNRRIWWRKPDLLNRLLYSLQKWTIWKIRAWLVFQILKKMKWLHILNMLNSSLPWGNVLNIRSTLEMTSGTYLHKFQDLWEAYEYLSKIK